MQADTCVAGNGVDWRTARYRLWWVRERQHRREQVNRRGQHATHAQHAVVFVAYVGVRPAVQLGGRVVRVVAQQALHAPQVEQLLVLDVRGHRGHAACP